VTYFSGSSTSASSLKFNDEKRRFMNAQSVLVVDDSGFARRTLRRILEEAGFEVVEADGGHAALEQYVTKTPDLVLLDVVMSGMGGLEVLRALRTLDRNARIVMATADIQESTRREALAAGAAGFVRKPIRAGDLFAELRCAFGDNP
jgi:two-component system chemotaxis response regulator CheY